MMTSPDDIVIKLSKTKAIIFSFGSIAFVMASIWILFQVDHQTRFSPVAIYIGGIAGALVFSMFGMLWIKAIFKNKPGIIINKDGIYDESGALGGHLIKWIDIKGTRVESVKRTKFLLVYVNNPECYFEGKTRFQKFWLNLNLKMYDTPIAISSNSLDCNFERLNQILEENIKKHSNQ